MYYILARSLPHIWAHQKALTWFNRHPSSEAGNDEIQNVNMAKFLTVEYDAMVEKTSDRIFFIELEKLYIRYS
jgi:hypothetical protein